MKILITGASGYIGAMLVDHFAELDAVVKVIGLDTQPKPAFLEHHPHTKKITWVIANTSDRTWQKKVADEKPDVVIHCAWQIREMHRRQKIQWRWNVDGSKAVFDFALETPSVKKLIHFSTASSYGADSENTLEDRFTEKDPLREEEYLYGFEKKVVEEDLREKYERSLKENAKKITQTFVVRPSSVTGPRGRYMLDRFGLQSVLRKWLPFIPIARADWCRQFIHEDDVCNIIDMLTTKDQEASFDIINITPESLVVASEMAEIMERRTFRVTPLLVRIAFFFAWHLSLGKIPTPRGGWKFFSYPIVLDAFKLREVYGYRLKYESREALETFEGRYKKYVPESEFQKAPRS